MARARLPLLVACLAVALATAGCAPATVPLVASDPSAPAVSAATATAYTELAAMQPSMVSYGLPTSLEDEVSHTPVIVIGKVTGVGSTFNSARTGDSMSTAPSPTYYSGSLRSTTSRSSGISRGVARPRSTPSRSRA